MVAELVDDELFMDEIKNKFHLYPDCNLKDLSMAINSAKVGLSLNKETNYKFSLHALVLLHLDN